MDENITDAIEFASTDNIADMQTSIQSALQSKIVDALEAKRIEVAQSFMQKTNESEEPVDDFEEEDLEEAKKLKGNQFKLDKNKNGKLDSQDFKLLKKESYLEEKLSVSDGISTWIKDFVHSDDSRFEGKSKEERRQMAMAAFYAAKKQQNEEIENIQELDKDTLIRYINKAGISRNDNRDAAKSAEAAAFKMKDDRIGDWKSMKSQEDSHNRTVKNREKGIKRASKKLTRNEEVEELEELSRSGIISRYLNKTKPEYSSPKEIEKRKEGRSLALKKIMGNKKFGFPEPKVKAKD